MVRALALRSGDPLFEFALIVPGSTSQLHLGFLTVVVVVFCCFVDCVSLALKSPYGERSKYVLYWLVVAIYSCVEGVAGASFRTGPETGLCSELFI